MSQSNRSQTALKAALGLISFPILILNFIGWITAFVWLVILGEWRELLLGIVLMLGASFVISFALIPGLIFSGLSTMALERGRKTLSMLLAFMNLIYTIVVMTAWCIWILQLFTHTATAHSLIPLLIWSYGVALGPWMLISAKENDDSSFAVTFFAQVTYVIGMILFYYGARIDEIAVAFGAIMLASSIIRGLIALSGPMVLPSKEVKTAIDMMDALEERLSGSGYNLVRNQIEAYLGTNSEEYIEAIKQIPPQQWIYSAIANIARNHVESGQYHFYRGVLNPTGESLLQLLNASIDELVTMGVITSKDAKKERKLTQKNIEFMG